VLSDAATDGIGSGSGQESGNTTVDSSDSTGCTAGPASSPTGPLGLVLMALAAVWLRRRQEVRARS
jgi:MYXO-CTERM domain-containing protein